MLGKNTVIMLSLAPVGSAATLVSTGPATAHCYGAMQFCIPCDYLSARDICIQGSPKPYCEDVVGDKSAHDYGPSTGFVIFLGNDGSLGPECPYSAGTENPTFDGHYEHAFGGAWLVSGTNAAAAAACGWPYPDHPAFA